MAQIVTVWKKELSDNLRDRRTLISAIILPMVIMPAILIGSTKLQESVSKSASEKTLRVAVHEERDAPSLVQFLKQQPKLELVTSGSDAKKDIDAGTVNLVLEVNPTFEHDLQAGAPTTVTLLENSSNFDSANTVSRAINAIALLNQQRAASILTEAHISPEALQPIVTKTVDLLSSEERGGFFLGLLLPMFLVIFSIVGGMYIAIDVSAGEKERKTLEALLFTPVKRFKLVLGKFLAVATVSSVTVVLSVFSLYASFKAFPPNFGDETGAIVFNLTPMTIGIMLVVGIMLSIMFSGLLISVAIFAKSYREAQNYISPFYLLAILPVSILNSIPGFKPTTIYYLLPGPNAVFALKDAFLNTLTPIHLMLTLGSLLVVAGIGLLIASKIYSKESILFRD